MVGLGDAGSNRMWSKRIAGRVVTVLDGQNFVSVTVYPFLSHLQGGACHIASCICCREYSPRVMIFALFAGSGSHPGTGGLYLTTLPPVSVTVYPFLSHQRGPCHIASCIIWCREYSPRVIFALFAGSGRSYPGSGGGLLTTLSHSGNLEEEELSENDGSFRLFVSPPVREVMEQDGFVVLGHSVPVRPGPSRLSSSLRQQHGDRPTEDGHITTERED